MGGYLKNGERELVYQKCKGHCGYCGNKIVENNFEVDHITPRLAFRDNPAEGNVFENLMPCCSRCNVFKSGNDLEQYREWVNKLHIELDTRLNRLCVDMGIIEGIVVWDGVFYFEKNI